MYRPYIGQLYHRRQPQYERELNELLKYTLQEHDLTQYNHKPTRHDSILYLTSDHDIVMRIVDMNAKTTNLN